MFSKSNVYALGLGLISSVSFGLTGVNAQISVTGGSMTGQAAFFVPNQITGGNGISLYGVSVQRLNLQTDQGHTSRAVFNAVNSSFTDVNANGLPDRNDTGILQGNLSGVAFLNGSPVGFTNRPTELEFTLNSFDSLLNFNGTLASPENFNSKLFLPDPLQYEGDQGVLQLGNFGANLDGGSIGLPNSYRFSDGTAISNNNNLQGSALRVRFQFRGTNVTPEEGTQLDPNSPMSGTEAEQQENGIVFIGEANDKFQVQTVGTRGTPEFKTPANATGTVAIAIGDISQSNLNGEFDLTQPLNYRIEGEALSVFNLLDDSFVATLGNARRDTKFSFEQLSTGASLQGRSDGFVAFAGLPETENFRQSLEALDAQSVLSTLDPDNCVVCSLGELNPEFSDLIGEASEDDASGIIINERDRHRHRDRIRDDDRDDDNTNVEVIGGDNSEVGQTIYLLSLTTADQPRIVVVLLGGDRYFVPVPGTRGRGHGRGLALGRRDRDQVVVFKQIGPSSRIFPGQVSIVEINLEDLPQGFAQALEEVLQDQGLVATNVTINNTTINNNTEVNVNGNNNEVNIDNNVENTNTTTETETPTNQIEGQN